MVADHSQSRTTRRSVLGALAGLGVTGVGGMVGATATRLTWEFNTDALVASSPTIVDETVFVGDYDGNVYALDAASGDCHWTFETADLVFSSPTVVDGVLFVGSRDGNVYALDAASGDCHWMFETGGAVSSSPTVATGPDGTPCVYIGSFDDNLYAIDAVTGEEHWHFAVGGEEMWSSPVVDGTTVYVGSDGGNVYALDVVSGDCHWTFETGDSVWSSPTLRGNSPTTVYVGSFDGNLYALPASPEWNGGTHRSEDEHWRFETDDLVRGVPAVAAVAGDETVFVGSYDGNLYALPASPEWGGGTSDSTDEIWRFETEHNLVSSPTVADETVIVGSRDGGLYAIDAATGTQRWAYETGEWAISSPTVVNGTIFVGVGGVEGRPPATGSPVTGVYAFEMDTGASSVDSRTWQGTLGHHDGWTHAHQTIAINKETTDDDTDVDSNSGSNDGDTNRTDDGDTDRTDAGTDDGETDSTDDGDASGPGLGVPGAVTGLAGVSYLLWRQTSVMNRLPGREEQ